MLSKTLAALLRRRQAQSAVKEDEADNEAGGTAQTPLVTVNEAAPVLVTPPPKKEQYLHHAHPPAASPITAKKSKADRQDVIYGERDLIPTCYHYRVYGKGKHRLTDANASVVCGKHEECWRPRFTGLTATSMSNLDGTTAFPPAMTTGINDSSMATEAISTSIATNNDNFSDPSPTNYMLKRGDPISNLRYWMSLRLSPGVPHGQQRKDDYLRDPVFKPEHLRAVTLDGLRQFKDLHEENHFLLAWAKREMHLACPREHQVLANTVEVANKIEESIRDEVSETDDSEEELLRTPDSACSGDPHFEEAARLGRENLERRKLEAQKDDMMSECMVVAGLLDQMWFLKERVDQAIVRIKVAKAKDENESERKFLDRMGVDWRV